MKLTLALVALVALWFYSLFGAGPRSPSEDVDDALDASLSTRTLTDYRIRAQRRRARSLEDPPRSID